MNARKPFLLRISPQLYQELEAWAQQEFRSVNAQIEYILKGAIRRRGRNAGGEVPPESSFPAQRPEADDDARE